MPSGTMQALLRRAARMIVLHEALSGGHWVTITDEEGIDTHLYISHGGGGNGKKGQVIAGPKHLIGANVAHLPPAPHFRTTEHAEGHQPKGATSHPSYTEHQFQKKVYGKFGPGVGKIVDNPLEEKSEKETHEGFNAAHQESRDAQDRFLPAPTKDEHAEAKAQAVSSLDQAVQDGHISPADGAKLRASMESGEMQPDDMAADVVKRAGESNLKKEADKAAADQKAAADEAKAQKDKENGLLKDYVADVGNEGFLDDGEVKEIQDGIDNGSLDEDAVNKIVDAKMDKKIAVNDVEAASNQGVISPTQKKDLLAKIDAGTSSEDVSKEIKGIKDKTHAAFTVENAHTYDTITQDQAQDLLDRVNAGLTGTDLKDAIQKAVDENKSDALDQAQVAFDTGQIDKASLHDIQDRIKSGYSKPKHLAELIKNATNAYSATAQHVLKDAANMGAISSEQFGKFLGLLDQGKLSPMHALIVAKGKIKDFEDAATAANLGKINANAEKTAHITAAYQAGKISFGENVRLRQGAILGTMGPEQIKAALKAAGKPAKVPTKAVLPKGGQEIAADLSHAMQKDIDAGDAKHQVMKSLGKTAESLGITQQAARDAIQAIWNGHDTSNGTPASDVEDLCNRTVATWAMSSGNSHPESLAFQLAAQEAFGLPTNWGEQPGHSGEQSWKKAQTLYAMHGDTMQRALFAMYNNTQEHLASQGVKSLTLMRGVSNVPSPKTFDAVKKKGFSASGKKKATDVAISHNAAPGELYTNPISSWTSSKIIAYGFSGGASHYTTGSDTGKANVILQAHIPADEILSHFRSGYGCMDEDEYTALGVTRPYVVTAGTSAQAMRDEAEKNAEGGYGMPKEKVAPGSHLMGSSASHFPTPAGKKPTESFIVRLARAIVLAEALSGGHWISIEDEEGVATHLFISNGGGGNGHKGQVIAGPSHLIGANIAHLPPAPHFRTTEHAEGHTPKGATSHPTYTEHNFTKKVYGKFGPGIGKEVDNPLDEKSKEEAHAAFHAAHNESRAQAGKDGAAPTKEEVQAKADAAKQAAADALHTSMVKGYLDKAVADGHISKADADLLHSQVDSGAIKADSLEQHIDQAIAFNKAAKAKAKATAAAKEQIDKAHQAGDITDAQATDLHSLHYSKVNDALGAAKTATTTAKAKAAKTAKNKADAQAQAEAKASFKAHSDKKQAAHKEVTGLQAWGTISPEHAAGIHAGIQNGAIHPDDVPGHIAAAKAAQQAVKAAAEKKDAAHDSISSAYHAGQISHPDYADLHNKLGSGTVHPDDLPDHLNAAKDAKTKADDAEAAAEAAAKAEAQKKTKAVKAKAPGTLTKGYAGAPKSAAIAPRVLDPGQASAHIDPHNSAASIAFMNKLQSRPDGAPGHIGSYYAKKITSDRMGKKFHSIMTDEQAEGLRSHLSLFETYGMHHPTEKLAAGLLKAWAKTSGDNDATSLAVQIAAQQEFGLNSWQGKQAHQGDDEYLHAQALATHPEYGTLLRKALRSVYDDTQAEFKAAGITHVTLVRGCNDIHSAAIKDAYNNRTHEAAVLDVPAGHLTTNPISSWCTHPNVATREEGMKFMNDNPDTIGEGGGTTGLLMSTVPIEHVFSHVRSGQSCLREDEMVLLGHDRPTTVVAGKNRAQVRKAAMSILQKGYVPKHKSNASLPAVPGAEKTKAVLPDRLAAPAKIPHFTG